MVIGVNSLITLVITNSSYILCWSEKLSDWMSQNIRLTIGNNGESIWPVERGGGGGGGSSHFLAYGVCHFLNVLFRHRK